MSETVRNSKAAIELPSMERLRELFDYDNGRLIWRSRAGDAKFNGQRAGRPAGGKPNSKGYLRVVIDGRQYLQHRIIYAWHHGKTPAFLDHRDGDPLNNSIENLRPATLTENARNAKARSGNYKGVNWRKKDKVWEARIRDKKPLYLGLFKTEEEAARAYDKKAREIHGSFARLNFPEDAPDRAAEVVDGQR